MAVVARGATTPPFPIAKGVSHGEGSAAETIKRLEDATVFIMVRSGRIAGSGSGVVIREDGDSLLIATNHHVVFPGGEAHGGDARRAIPPPTVSVVLRSGNGPVEQTLPATILASDGEGTHDLAILLVKAPKDPPFPIQMGGLSIPAITTPVRICGFPFGRLIPGTGNPRITINNGSISSVKQDGAGGELIQVNGAMDPGNSGGPVVDHEGRLVGIAVAKINSGIGFAIPSAELVRMLNGRLGAINVEMRGEKGGQAELDIRARRIDPLKHIQAAELLYAPALGPAQPSPDREGNWPRIPATQSLSLDLNDAEATGHLLVPGGAAASRRIVVQAAYHLASGEVLYTKPQPCSPARPDTGPLPGPGSSFAELRPPIDSSTNQPAKDSEFRKDDNSMTIEVPSGVHMIIPEMDSKGAVMSLTDVEGDFIAIAKVGGTMVPGMEPVKFKGKLRPQTFQGAGLVLWQDDKNYICIERTARCVLGRGAVLTTEVLVEIVKGGKSVVMPPPFKIPDGPVFVRIQRVDNALSVLFGPDERTWLTHRKLAVTFPEKIQVGLVASNASREPLSARFDAFVLVRDREDVAKQKVP